MAEKLDESFVVARANHLSKLAGSTRGPVTPPVDLSAMFEHCRIVDCVYHNMIPEGVIQPVPGGFVLYVQNNFRERSASSARERFTIAHEIAHTFFFDDAHPVPRPKRGVPRGEKLEQLCHIGARELLMPPSLVGQELKIRGGLSSLEDVEFLAQRFDVSIEVVLRFLRRHSGLCNAELAVVYVRTRMDGATEVRAEFHDASFLPIANPPKVGENFSEWISTIAPEATGKKPGTWEVALRSGSARVTVKHLGRWSSLVGIERTG